MKHLIRDGVWRSGSTAIRSTRCTPKWKRREPPSSSNPTMVRSGAPSSLLIPMATGLRPTKTPGTAFLWAAGKSARSTEGPGRVQGLKCERSISDPHHLQMQSENHHIDGVAQPPHQMDTHCSSAQK